MNLHDKILAEAMMADAVRCAELSMQSAAKAITALFAHAENNGMAEGVDADLCNACERYDKYIRLLRTIEKTIKGAT